ncbi:GAF domain-containing protein [Variovorax sp. PvP013]|jgi:GAF domain-containing protein|uniref:GAF domain-containing protein n=1 Tax=Variovorax sp. PvP013 TaxID=3156435 RepID=UPI003D229707
MSARDPLMTLEVFDRQLSRLAIATAERSDTDIHRSVGEVLQLVRDHLQMDVVFVSRFENGRRVFRHVEQDPARPLLQVGHSDPLEMSLCQRVVDGRMPELVRDVARLPDADALPPLPFRIGAHLSTPLVLGNGEVYGTFCCFSLAPDETLTERDLKRLRMASEMTARLIDRSSADSH